jgi:hypothetical protein
MAANIVIDNNVVRSGADMIIRSTGALYNVAAALDTERANIWSDIEGDVKQNLNASVGRLVDLIRNVNQDFEFLGRVMLEAIYTFAEADETEKKAIQDHLNP